LTSIGDYAFQNCTALASIEIPASVTSIGYVAFSGCSSLKNVTFDTTSGWKCYTSSTATSGTIIAENNLINTQTAAKYLTDTYDTYYWKHN
jgi:hypothetical protein